MGSPAHEDGLWRTAAEQYRDGFVTIDHALTSDAVGPQEALRLVATVVDSLRPLGDELFGSPAPGRMSRTHEDAVTCPLCDGERVVDGLLVGGVTVAERCGLCRGKGKVAAGAGREYEAEWDRLDRGVPAHEVEVTRVTPAALWLAQRA